MTFLQPVYADNELWVWFLALGIFVGTFSLLKLAKWLLHRRLRALREKTKRDFIRR